MKKAFLSSPNQGLIDARYCLTQKLKEECKDTFEIIAYETHKHLYSNLPPEETCLRLVQDCTAIILIVDQYYGSEYSENRNISITHAEILEAKKRNATVVPIARTQTWHEFLVWRLNKEKDITFAYVREPKLFLLMDEIGTSNNWHFYDNFVDENNIKKIADALRVLVTNNGSGMAEHTVLAFEAKKYDITDTFSRFLEGEVLTASKLNTIYSLISEVGYKYGLNIKPHLIWSSNDILKARDLNVMLRNVNKIYQHNKKPLPEWSFVEFEDGQVLKASQLNEIVDNLEIIKIV